MKSGEAQRHFLLQLYSAALARVAGDRLVASYLAIYLPAGSVVVVAIGKAAAAMMAGAQQALGERLAKGLVITKQGHLPAKRDDSRITWLEAGHPIPDDASLAAGRQLLEFLARAPAGAELLFLISGGASALVELLPEGVGLETLERANQWLLASGRDIDAINRVRKGLSCIKAGRLARYLGGRPTRNLMLSDVPGDDPKVIGSGLLVPHPPEALRIDFDLPDWLAGDLGQVPAAPVPDEDCFTNITTHLIGSNQMARTAAAEAALAAGCSAAVAPSTFTGNTPELGRRFARELCTSPPGVYVWGGESTIVLPERPGRGGRNQALALAAAGELAGREDIFLLAAGTDGTDGPTEDAGALVDGGTIDRGRLDGLDPDDCLRRADSGRFLEASGDLIQTGPTGTNVMDLVIGLKI